MRLNKILVVGCLMLGFPAASLSAPFNPNDLFKVESNSHDAAGSFARTASKIADTDKSVKARKYLGIADAKIAQDPNNDIYYFGRAQIYRDLQEYRSSLADITHAISLKPHNQSYYDFRAVAWSLLDDYAAALQDVNRAISIGPENADLFIRRASLLQLLRRYDESLSSANRSIAMDSSSAESYVIRGITKFHLKDYRGAQMDCKKAESLKPSSTKDLRQLLSKVNM